MSGFLFDTISELRERKTFYVYIVVTLLTVLMILGSSALNINGSFQIQGDFESGNLNDVLGNPLMSIFGVYVSFLVFLSVMATAGLIPNMLEKGRADFYLAKPYTRISLLINKFISVWLVYGILIIVSSLIVFLSLLLVYDFSDSGIFMVLFFYLINLFIWMSIALLGGVVSGSTGIAFISVFLIWIMQKIFGFNELVASVTESTIVKFFYNTVYQILPKTAEIAYIGESLATGRNVESYSPIFSSLVFAVALVVITLYIFKQKDY